MFNVQNTRMYQPTIDNFLLMQKKRLYKRLIGIRWAPEVDAHILEGLKAKHPWHN